MNFTTFNQPTVVTAKSGSNDSFAEILKESFEYFAQSNVQMVSGFSEILGEDALFQDYVGFMTNGLGADEAEQLSQILENARLTTLQESTVTQVTPLVGLTMPTIRKMWVKTALKNAIPTEVAKVPSFTIAWHEPYTYSIDPKTGRRVKRALPQAADGMRDLVNLPKIEHPEATGYYPVGVVNNVIDTTLVVRGEAEADAQGNVKRKVGDAVDPIFSIVALVVDGVEQPEVIKLDIQSGFYKQVKVEDKVCQLFGNLNCETGDMTIAVVGEGADKVQGVKVAGHLTHENNERSESVSFDIRRKDVRIGVGSHINAELPIEWLQDTMALYNIDATVEVVDLMSNLVAQKLDHEIIDFLENSFINSGAAFKAKFDLKPSAGFAGSPTEWRHEIRTTIEWWATRLKSYTQFTQGHFVIIGHPIDINIIPDIQWQFRSAQAERGGVHVNYDFGVITAANVYQVVSSENIRSGKLIMFFVPSTSQYMTYKYYPYTFNIEKGYISPNMERVPSIMMTKRHKLEELFPMQVQIQILNNNGEIITSYAL